MNNLVKFDFNGNGVRTQCDESGVVWFNGQDVAQALGYVKPRNAIRQHCKAGGALIRGTPTESGIQQMLFINESNVYRLIAHSRLPAAEKFEAWIFEEVLPAIRRDGGYISPAASIEQLEALNAKLGSALIRIKALEAENHNLELQDRFFGNRVKFGSISPKTGKPRTQPVHGHYKSPRGEMVVMSMDLFQYLFPVQEVRAGE